MKFYELTARQSFSNDNRSESITEWYSEKTPMDKLEGYLASEKKQEGRIAFLSLWEIEITRKGCKFWLEPNDMLYVGKAMPDVGSDAVEIYQAKSMGWCKMKEIEIQ